jgi:2-oxoglutarate dehydrogenase E2 component (dihydrolipoamide succinyltransferase)
LLARVLPPGEAEYLPYFKSIYFMALVDLVMPKMGESIMEATVLRWHKKPGDFIKQDETIMDIATDKVDSEVPSTAEGILEEALFQENDVVPVGTVIARIGKPGVIQHYTGTAYRNDDVRFGPYG